jgi:hypothetical protein
MTDFGSSFSPSGHQWAGPKPNFGPNTRIVRGSGGSFTAITPQDSADFARLAAGNYNENDLKAISYYGSGRREIFTAGGGPFYNNPGNTEWDPESETDMPV